MDNKICNNPICKADNPIEVKFCRICGTTTLWAPAADAVLFTLSSVSTFALPTSNW